MMRWTNYDLSVRAALAGGYLVTVALLFVAVAGALLPDSALLVQGLVALIAAPFFAVLTPLGWVPAWGIYRAFGVARTRDADARRLRDTVASLDARVEWLEAQARSDS